MTNNKNMWAILIGIDCYMDNRLPDGSWYPSLTGCVRDVRHVERFLRARLGLTDERIFTLTATNATIPPNDGDPLRRPVEPPENWPTYENMVAMFERMTEQAKPGDQVYLHYSGHGGRVVTAFPALKGENGFDEALVPTDIGRSEARYFRDVELAYLIQKMVDKGLSPVVTLDSCHSAGMSRGSSGAVPRGISSPDTGVRRTDSAVAPNALLEEAWRSAAAGTRGLKAGGGWLLEPRAYTLLAACRAQESAFEYPFDGRECNGALTYWLLDSLKQIGRGWSYKMLHDRILAKVHGQFAAQTPQLQGEGSRVVFGSDQVEPVYAALVLEVDNATNRVRINAGQAHLVRRGAQFSIHAGGADGKLTADSRLALAEVDEAPGATETWATITTKLRDEPILEGAQAVLLEPGSTRLQRPVALITRSDLPLTIDQESALARVRRALEQEGSGFAPLAPEGGPAVFQVAVNERSELEIWDAAGASINVQPPVPIDDPNAPTKIVRRLVHMAKYRNVQELDNHDPLSPLAGQLQVELVGKATGYEPGDEMAPVPFGDPGSTPRLEPDEWVFVRIKNRLGRVAGDHMANVLNITVLNLASDGSISQIHPRQPGAYFVPLDPEAEIVLPLQASLPVRQDLATDIVKVFGTVGTTSFRWLELPALDQPIVSKSAACRGWPMSSLDALLAAVIEEHPRARVLNTAAYPSAEWITAQVEVQVARPGAADHSR